MHGFGRSFVRKRMKGGVYQTSSEENVEARISHFLPNSAQGATHFRTFLRTLSRCLCTSFWLLTMDGGLIYVVDQTQTSSR